MRVLIAWELGANAGHGVKLAAMARVLRRAGHQVDFALQRLDAARAFRDQAEAPGTRLWQAPFWPGLLRPSGPVQAWGDVLAEAGMTDSGVLEYLLRGWETILTAAKPDLVLAEFAPAVQLAAAGRVPLVALGTGYTVPPSTEAGFMPFLGPAPRYDEAALLRLVNHALTRVGRAALPALGAMARADLHLPACFAELDPYGPRPGLPPFLAGPVSPAQGGKAIFAYLPQPPKPAIEALTRMARAGTEVLLHAPGLVDSPLPLLPGPLSQVEIARRAGVILGTGGLGLTSAALAMGLPQVLLPLDAEKHLNATAAARLGAALALAPKADADQIAQALRQARDLAPRAAALAPDFAARLAIDPAEAALQQISALRRD